VEVGSIMKETVALLVNSSFVDFDLDFLQLIYCFEFAELVDFA